MWVFGNGTKCINTYIPVFEDIPNPRPSLLNRLVLEAIRLDDCEESEDFFHRKEIEKYLVKTMSNDAGIWHLNFLNYRYTLDIMTGYYIRGMKV